MPEIEYGDAGIEERNESESFVIYTTGICMVGACTSPGGYGSCMVRVGQTRQAKSMKCGLT